MIVLVLLILVISGFAGLTYELVWTKHLMLVFGVSHAAISTVLAAFMAGLAIGSVALGRVADRVRHPLRLYALLELGVGASAAALPFTLSAVNDAYVSMARGMPAHSWALAAARFLLCFALLLVPTTLMGGTLPAIGRHVIRRSEAVGLGAGVLYGANTVGGILGAAMTGFVLLGAMGAHRTAMLAVALNAAAAAAAGALSLKAAPIRPGEPGPAAQPAGPSPAPDRPALATFVLIAFGISGAASLAYEVLWTRVLIYFMDLTIYSFTTILVTFLTGLALGSFLFARWADRVRNLLGLFGSMQLAIALSAMYVVHSLGKLFSVAERVAPSVASDPEAIFMVVRFTIASVFILLPTIVMGGTFPVVARLYTRDLRRLGRSLGDLYGANTLGCVIGSLAAGFVLLHLVGAQQAIGLVALVSGALGIGAIIASRARRAVLLSLAAAGVLAVGMLLAWRVPPAVMFSRRAIEQHLELLHYKEGPEASLAVLRNPFGSREININGLSTAYSDYGDILSHKLLAHPPALMAREPRSALVVGLGMGSTVWSLAQYPLERIDCVELVPAERETATFFLPENGGVLDDPRVTLIIGDGRNYLLTTSRKYDIISFNAIHPAFSPYLYTREFYQLCKSRLTDDGVICGWLPTNSGHFPSLLATFREVFPHCSLWVANLGHLAIIGTREPQVFDLSRIRDAVTSPGVRRNLAEVHLEEPLALLARAVMDEEAVRRYAADHGARVNTDDLPHVEFDTTVDPVAHCVSTMKTLLPYFSSRWEQLARRPAGPGGEATSRRELEAYAAAFRLSMEAAVEAAEGRPWEALLRLKQAADTAPESYHARFMHATVLAEPSSDRLFANSPENQRRRAAGIAEVIRREAQRAEADVGLPARYLSPLRLRLARILLELGEKPEALRYVDDVLAADPEVAFARRLQRELAEADSPSASGVGHRAPD